MSAGLLVESKPGVAVAVAGDTGIAGAWGLGPPSSPGALRWIGGSGWREGRTVPAALIGSPGVNANGMTRNPVNGRPGGAVRRVSQCQSAGSGLTIAGPGAV